MISWHSVQRFGLDRAAMASLAAAGRLAWHGC
jgi:hypothetical protein